MEKKKKINTSIISFCAAAIVVAIVLGFVIYGAQKPTIQVLEDAVKIKSLYGLTVEYSEIIEISLIEKSIADIDDTLKRTNGFGGIGKTLKGSFQSNNLGNIFVFAYRGASPTIWIERKDKKDVYINYKNSAETTKLYAELRLKYEDK